MLQYQNKRFYECFFKDNRQIQIYIGRDKLDLMMVILVYNQNVMCVILNVYILERM